LARLWCKSYLSMAPCCNLYRSAGIHGQRLLLSRRTFLPITTILRLRSSMPTWAQQGLYSKSEMCQLAFRACRRTLAHLNKSSLERLLILLPATMNGASWIQKGLGVMQRRPLSNSKLLAKKPYTILRVGTEAVGGQSYPEELIVWPADGAVVHRGFSDQGAGEKGLFGIPTQKARRSTAWTQLPNMAALLLTITIVLTQLVHV